MSKKLLVDGVKSALQLAFVSATYFLAAYLMGLMKPSMFGNLYAGSHGCPIKINE